MTTSSPHAIDYETTGFTSQGEAIPRIVDAALAVLANRVAPTLLDLGCGSGVLGITAAQKNPALHVVAVDISPSNVQATRAAADAVGVGARVETICCDYMTWQGRLFDVIVSDSVLQLIVGANEKLAARLAADLSPGGMMIAALPVESAFNSLRITIRGLWRLMPNSADALVMAVARRVYPDMPENVLADRLPYMRVVPERLYGADMRTLFASSGLAVVSAEPLKSTSAAKLAHEIVIWQRGKSVASRR